MNPERRRQIVTRCGLDAIYLHYSERQPGIDPPPPLRFRRNPKRIALLDLRHLVEDACSCQHECYGGRSRNHQDAVDFPATATERAKAAMTISASSLAGDERSPGVQAVLHQRTALGVHKRRKDRPRACALLRKVSRFAASVGATCAGWEETLRRRCRCDLRANRQPVTPANGERAVDRDRAFAVVQPRVYVRLPQTWS